MTDDGQRTFANFGGDHPAAAVDESQTRLTEFVTANAQTATDAAAWRPGGTESPTCDRCGTHVSPSFHRLWRDNDGVLDGCRQCLPRSVRFGEDVYGRTKDEAQASFDPDAPNEGRDAEDRRNTPRPDTTA